MRRVDTDRSDLGLELTCYPELKMSARCLLNAASVCLCVVLARFRLFAARSIGAPSRQNDGIICLREHKLCPAARSSTIRAAPISLWASSPLARSIYLAASA